MYHIDSKVSVIDNVLRRPSNAAIMNPCQHPAYAQHVQPKTPNPIATHQGTIVAQYLPSQDYLTGSLDQSNSHAVYHIVSRVNIIDYVH